MQMSKGSKILLFAMRFLPYMSCSNIVSESESFKTSSATETQRVSNERAPTRHVTDLSHSAHGILTPAVLPHRLSLTVATCFAFLSYCILNIAKL